jgi:hypothetical protein
VVPARDLGEVPMADIAPAFANRQQPAVMVGNRS